MRETYALRAVALAVLCLVTACDCSGRVCGPHAIERGGRCEDIDSPPDEDGSIDCGSDAADGGLRCADPTDAGTLRTDSGAPTGGADAMTPCESRAGGDGTCDSADAGSMDAASPCETDTVPADGSCVPIDAGAIDANTPDTASPCALAEPEAPVETANWTMTELSLPAVAVVGDTTRGRLYAVLGEAAPYPDRLVTIDAEHAMVIHDVEVGPSPATLAISADDTTLWVGMSGSSEIRRVDLTGELPVPGARHALTTSSFPYTAGEMVVLEGNSDAVAISLRKPGSPSFGGLMLLEDGVLRPIGHGSSATRVTPGPDGYLFGFNDETTSHHFYGIDLALDDADAARHENLVYGFFTDIVYDADGFVFATSGEVVDVRAPAAPKRAGVFAHSGAVLPESGGSGVLMVSIDARRPNGFVLRNLDSATFAQHAHTALGSSQIEIDFVTDLVQASPRHFGFIAGSEAFRTASVFVLEASDDPFAVPRTIPAAGQPVAGGRLIEIPVEAKALVADPRRRLLYATVAGGAAALENSLVTIDPDLPAIVHSMPIGSEPSPLALSEDGSTLWVGLAGSYEVRSIDLTACVPVLAAPHPLHLPEGEQGIAHSIVVLPSTKSSIAVSMHGARFDAALAVLDDGIARTKLVTERAGYRTQLTLGPAGRLFGFDASSSAESFFSIGVDATGIEQTIHSGLVAGETARIAYDADGMVYSSSGMVVDVTAPSAPERAGAFELTGGVLPLPESATALMVSPGDGGDGPPLLRNLQSDTFTQRIEVELGVPTQARGPIGPVAYLEPDTLAFIAQSSTGQGSSIYLVDEETVRMVRTAPPPAPTLAASLDHGELRELPVAARALVADPVRSRIYATIAGDAPLHANQLVTIDALDGEVIDAVAIGSSPTEMAVSDDGSTLWVSLSGSFEIRRVDISTATPTPGPSHRLPLQQFDERAEAETMVVLPGTTGSVAAALHDRRITPSFTGVVVLDDGVPRPTQGTARSGAARIVTGPTGYIFGYDEDISDGAFHPLVVSASGVEHIGPGVVGVLTCCDAEISYDPDGFVYASSGHIVNVSDPEAPVSAGAFPFAGAVLPLPQSDRALMVSNEGAAPAPFLLRTLSTATLSQVSSRALGPDGHVADSVSHLVHAPPHSLAFIATASSGDGLSVYILNDPDLFP
jgi:DNA-binding beta-propeller fold protein YncE